MSEYLSNPEQEAKEYLPKYKYLYGIVGLTFMLFFGRLWHLQIIQGSQLRTFSEQNRIKQTRIPAPRGIIMDRHGKVLVENLSGFVATISPQYVEDLQKTAETTGKILEIASSKIIEKVKKSQKQNGPFFPVVLKENLTREEVFRLQFVRLDNPGLEISEAILRSYPLLESGSHLFGYVGEISKKQISIFNERFKNTFGFRQGDIIGKAGLEEFLEKYIRGKDGVATVQVDAHGREMTIRDSSIVGELKLNQDPIAGFNIHLNIDKDLQNAAYQAFTSSGHVGAVVALKPDGEVLVWLSTPAYDPNQFATRISVDLWSQLSQDRFRPLRNKVIQDHLSPGSTFKAIVALAALQEKVITPQTTFFCPGHIRFGRKPYHCSAKHGHGEVNLSEAIERSCNVYFYRVGSLLGIDKIAKYATLLGLGQKTGVDVQNEVPGLMPTTAWKKKARHEEWQPGENLSNAIGAGFVLITPLQLAMAYSTIASDGMFYRPFVVRKITDSEDQLIKEYNPTLIRDLTKPDENGDFIDPSAFAIVKKALTLVTNGDHGTARWWKIPGVPYAGKTGTQQLHAIHADQIYSRCEDKPFEQRHHGWFVAFAPVDHPFITVAVLAEHACHGSTAAPVARAVIKSFFEKYHPDMIKSNTPIVAASKKTSESTINLNAEGPPRQDLLPEGE